MRDISVGELDRLATIRKAMIDGTATADMIAEAEREASERSGSVEQEIKAFFDLIYSRLDEPIYLFLSANMV